MSRWTKQVMKSAGVDITSYSGHSTRSAFTSSRKSENLSAEEIMKASGWSNSGTFAKFYHKPIDTVARFNCMVLQQLSDTYTLRSRRSNEHFIGFCFVL